MYKIIILLSLYELLPSTILKVEAKEPTLINVGTLAISDEVPDNNGLPDPPHGCLSGVCQGRVWLFSNDVYNTNQWGTISGEGMTDYEKTVICRQLGYSSYIDTPTHELDNTSPPVWLTEISCDSNVTNILQCDYKPCEFGMSCYDHSEDLLINCRNNLYHNRMYYDGEAYLCPPDNKPTGMQATLGLMQIFIKQDHAKSVGVTVRQLSDAANLGASKMDSFCREMGFSRAEFDVYTQQALKGLFNFTCNDTLCLDVATLKNSSDDYIASTPCFGCWYDYPDSAEYIDCNGSALVISCVYDPKTNHHDTKIKGDQEKCEFEGTVLPHEKEVCKSPCPQESDGVETQTFVVTTTVLLSTTTIAILLVVGLGLCLIRKLYKKDRNGYGDMDRMDEDELH